MVGLLCANDQIIAQAVTYAKHKKHKRPTPIPSAGFEAAIPAIRRQQTDFLDSTATAIGHYADNWLFFGIPIIHYNL
jgi:hypothetical protein